MGAATGVTWMILVFFVPAIIVSLGLMAWQLVARRHEALTAGGRNAPSLAREQLLARP
jgi:cytochrome oxidase assembly protein ShyY1